MSYILALDQGTTSSRAIVFDNDAIIVGMAQKEIRQVFPAPGLVEHDANEIWSTQAGVAQEAIARAGIRAADITAIGITNQRETVVAWDRTTGRPVHNAIVWQDRRTAADCEALRAAGHERAFREKTGLLLVPYFSGTKMRWILDHVPGARELADRGELAFGTIDSWLVHNLTARRLHLTDATNASRTLLYDIHAHEWDDELLAILDIPRSTLPEVRSSSEVYGETVGGLFGASIPIAGIAGDQQAATFGQACLDPGMAKNTYGTGCFMLMNTGREAVPSPSQLLTTVAWRLPGRTDYALEGSIYIAGAVVQWLRDGLGIVRDAAEVEALALRAPDNGGVYLVPAFVGLGAPHWDDRARGLIIGLTRGSTAAHIARAALESIAYQTADVLEAMQRDSGVSLSELRVDGGAARNDLLMQFQADVLGVPVVRPRITETTALGAAYLAGLAVGYWDGTEQIVERWQVDRRFEPAMSAAERERLLEQWRRAVSRSTGWEQAADPGQGIS